MDASEIANKAKSGFKQSMAHGKLNLHLGKAAEVTRGLKGSLKK